MSSERLSTSALETGSYHPMRELKRGTVVWTDAVLVAREAQVLLLSPVMIYFRLKWTS